MALVLIFFGSVIGLTVGAIQMISYDATLAQASLTYLAMSLGVPMLAGTSGWVSATLRALLSGEAPQSIDSTHAAQTPLRQRPVHY